MNSNDNVIDITKDINKDIPITLQNEILLEKTYDNNGNLTGYLTTSIENIQKMKDKINTNGTCCDEYKYKHITDTF